MATKLLIICNILSKNDEWLLLPYKRNCKKHKKQGTSCNLFIFFALNTLLSATFFTIFVFAYNCCIFIIFYYLSVTKNTLILMYFFTLFLSYNILLISAYIYTTFHNYYLHAINTLISHIFACVEPTYKSFIQAQQKAPKYNCFGAFNLCIFI